MRLIFLLSFFLPSLGFGQSDRVKQFTKTLCSSEFHGRGYVNGGDSIAAEYIANTFKELGLKQIANSYFQPFSFSVNTFPNELELKLGNRLLVPGIHYLVDPSSGGGKFEGNLLTLTFDDLYNNKFESKKIKQGTVLIWKNIGYSGDTLKKLNQKLASLRSSAPIIEVVNTKFTWSVSQEGRKYPFLQVQDSVYNDSISRVAINIYAQTIRHNARNVLGFLPAKKNTDKTILISAHYDHLGQMGSETYFPGGNDNASGNAMLIALIEKLKQSPLRKYNVLFVAFAGEEIGLLGSQFMVKHPIIPLKDIRFMLNLDIMGSGEEGITVVNSTLFKKEFNGLLKLNKKLNAVPLVKPRGPAANSDHFYFTEAGVPAFFIYTMGPNKHYHDVFDTYEELSFKAFDSLSLLLEKFVRKL